MNDSVTTVGASILLFQVYKVWGIAATQLPAIKHCCSSSLHLWTTFI